MNEHERRFLRFLSEAQEGGVSVVQGQLFYGDGEELLVLYHGDYPEDLDFGAARRLADEGYINLRAERAASAQADLFSFSIKREGKELIQRGFLELPTPPSGGQVVQFINSTAYNTAVSSSGDASISGSPIFQGIADVDELFAGLVDRINASGLPQERKADAALEAQQLGAELKKSQPARERVLGSLDTIEALGAGATGMVQQADALWDAVVKSGWWGLGP